MDAFLDAMDWEQGFSLALFAFVFLAVIIVVVMATRQLRAYREHVAEVSRINAEVQAMNRENLAINRQNTEIARESLATLKAIQTLLESRNS